MNMNLNELAKQTGDIYIAFSGNPQESGWDFKVVSPGNLTPILKDVIIAECFGFFKRNKELAGMLEDHVHAVSGTFIITENSIMYTVRGMCAVKGLNSEDLQPKAICGFI